MLNYPETILVSPGLAATTYRRQPDVLVEFRGLPASEAGVEPLLAHLGLPPGRRSRHVVTDKLSRNGLLRVPEERLDEALTKLKALSVRARPLPIYYEEGKGDESAAIPIIGAVTFKPVDGQTAQDTATWLSERGFVLDAELSQLIEPFLYFYRPAGSPNTPGLNAETFLRNLRERPDVELADFDWVKQQALATQPTDPKWPNQQLNFGLILMDKVFDLIPDFAALPTTRLAILDSGFDLAHPDLSFALDHLDLTQHHEKVEGNIWLLDGNSQRHGTAVAGIAAARLNGIGTAGIAGGWPILPASLGDYPSAALLAAGLNWSIRKQARVVNMSVSVVPTACARWFVQKGWDNHLVLCAAAGNAEVAYTEFPANHPKVIGVGAANKQGLLKTHGDNNFCFGDDGGVTSPWGSQYGAGLSVLAPGVDCWTAYPNKGARAVCGTSAAAPHVAGLAALIRSINPGLSNQQVRTIIESNSQKVGPYTYTNGRSTEAGYGLIDCLAAVRAAKP